MLSPLPIRLFCDLAMPAQSNDLNRNSQMPMFYRGDNVEIDIGIGQNAALLTSLANLVSVTAQIFQAQNDTNPPMMSCTVLAAAMTLGLTQANWTANAGCHAAFTWTSTQTAITLNGASSVNYWLRITALTNDTPAISLTLLDAPITVKDGPVSTLAVPAAAAAKFVTVGGVPTLALYDATAAGYRAVTILNDGGVATLTLSDQLY